MTKSKGLRRGPRKPAVYEVDVQWCQGTVRCRVLGEMDNGRFRVDLVRMRDLAVCTDGARERLGAQIRSKLTRMLRKPVGPIASDRMDLEVD